MKLKFEYSLKWSLCRFYLHLNLQFCVYTRSISSPQISCYQIPHQVQEGYIYISKMVKSKFVWMKLFNIIHREKYCILKQTVKISLKNKNDENFLPSATLLPIY